MSLTAFYKRRAIFGRFNLVLVQRWPSRWAWWSLERFVPNRTFWHVPLFPTRREQ